MHNTVGPGTVGSKGRSKNINTFRESRIIPRDEVHQKDAVKISLSRPPALSIYHVLQLTALVAVLLSRVDSTRGMVFASQLRTVESYDLFSEKLSFCNQSRSQ